MAIIDPSIASSPEFDELKAQLSAFLRLYDIGRSIGSRSDDSMNVWMPQTNESYHLHAASGSAQSASSSSVTSAANVASDHTLAVRIDHKADQSHADHSHKGPVDGKKHILPFLNRNHRPDALDIEIDARKPDKTADTHNHSQEQYKRDLIEQIGQPIDKLNEHEALVACGTRLKLYFEHYNQFKGHLSIDNLCAIVGIQQAGLKSIFRGERKPKRDVVLAICLTLGLPERQTQSMLLLLGEPLHETTPRDLIILFALRKGLYLDMSNELLADQGYPGLA